LPQISLIFADCYPKSAAAPAAILGSGDVARIIFL